MCQQFSTTILQYNDTITNRKRNNQGVKRYHDNILNSQYKRPLTPATFVGKKIFSNQKVLTTSNN